METKRIKHNIRDLGVFLIDICGLSALYRAVLRRRGPLVRVLCFHDVSDKEWFETVVGALVEECRVLTPQEFHAGAFLSGKINILFTFDDGYQSWIDICLPALDKFNIKGLFFVNSGLLDISSDDNAVRKFMTERLLISPKKPLTWEGARLIASRGHTIGGHTINHPNLTTLTLDDAKFEVANDKNRLETLLNLRLNDFAYPFGRQLNYNDELNQVVIGENYKYIYSALPGFYRKEEKEIQRTLIDQSLSARQINYWIGGSYDLLKFII